MSSDWLDVFPVGGENYSYAEAFNAQHRGTDIFADKGTPVLAVVDGMARSDTDIPDGPGGVVVYLESTNLNQPIRRYYYAHLDMVEAKFEDREFHPVKAGEQLGTVGDSGNAKGKPPHLHFQMGGERGTPAVNPFPELVKVDEKRGGAPSSPPADIPVPPPPDFDAPTTPTVPSLKHLELGAVVAVLALLWFLGKRRHA